jgi:unsaturated chondroitin disaccharide hydrolase
MPSIAAATVAEAFEALLGRIATTLDDVRETFPLFANPETGTWETTDDGDWCGGHWIGLLWLASHHTDEPETARRFADAARARTEVMHRELPRNTMFYGLSHQYAGFHAYDLTGNRAQFGLGLDGADAMVKDYHKGTRQIPLGEFQIRGPDNFRGAESEHSPSGARIGAVDNVYTALPVLWRAYRETGDPRFRDLVCS